MPLDTAQLEGQRHYQYHKRLHDTEGAIVDVGCLNFDWSRRFQDRRVVGIDPMAGEYRRKNLDVVHSAVVPTVSDNAVIYGQQLACTTVPGEIEGSHRVHALSLQQVVEAFSPIALLKMNIEGGEYLLLPSVRHPIADQLIVSFHDFEDDRWEGLTDGYVNWLSRWYEPYQTCSRWRWWLFLRR